MNTKEFIKELEELIQKFNESQGAYLLDIDLYTSINTHATGKKDIEYNIEVKICSLG